MYREDDDNSALYLGQRGSDSLFRMIKDEIIDGTISD